MGLALPSQSTKEFALKQFTVIALSFLALVPASAGASDAQAMMNQMTVRSLPVFNWLVVGESTDKSVLPSLQKSGMLLSEGVSAYTGGKLINAANLSIKKPSALDVPGLKIISMSFNRSQKLESVVMMIDRGYGDAAVPRIVSWLDGKYSGLATPRNIRDDRGEGEDRYRYYDFGRFAVELSVPEYGSYANITFATKSLHQSMRQADGTSSVFDQAR